MKSEAIGLYELNQRLKATIRDQFLMPIWVVAEINQLTQHRSGHCYLELVEKDPVGKSITASCRATIWASSFHRLNTFFRTSTGAPIEQGMKVLVKAQPDFHELYGLSLNIRDIDPSYTLGDLAQKRAEILRKLEEDGVLDMNRELELPLVIQRIAIISSPQAAGYQDFNEQLTQNKNLIFYPKLFPAAMQGDQTGPSVIQALDHIAAYVEHFDAVVLIRGGGSKTDLSYFDDYELAYYITQFPLPVLTGIGHEKDLSICDEVAHLHFKTPTAVAEFIRSGAEQYEAQLDWTYDQIFRLSQNLISDHRNNLELALQQLKLGATHHLSTESEKISSLGKQLVQSTKLFIQKRSSGLLQMNRQLPYASKSLISKNMNQLGRYTEQLKGQVKMLIKERKNKLTLLDKQAEYLDPEKLLSKGYSLSYFNGRLLKSIKNLNQGDQVITRHADGFTQSTVDKIQENDTKE